MVRNQENLICRILLLLRPIHYIEAVITIPDHIVCKNYVCKKKWALQKSSKFVRHHLWMIPYGGAVEITPVLLKYIHITLCLYTWKVGVDQFPTSLYVPAALRCKYLIRRVYLWDNFLPGSVINSISGIYSPHRGLLQPTVCFFILRSLHHDAAAVEVTARAARAMSWRKPSCV